MTPQGGGPVCLMDYGKHRTIPDWDTFSALGFTDTDKAKITKVPDSQFKAIPTGADFTSLKDGVIFTGGRTNGNALLVYMMDAHKRRLIAEPATLAALGGKYITIPTLDADRVPQGSDWPKYVPPASTPKDGTVVQQQSTGAVCLIDGGTSRHIPDWDTFYALGLTDSDKANITMMPDSQFNAIPKGDDYKSLKDTVMFTGGNGWIYRMDKHKKRSLPDMATINALGGSYIKIPLGDVARIPTGPDWPKGQ